MNFRKNQEKEEIIEKLNQLFQLLKDEEAKTRKSSTSS